MKYTRMLQTPMDWAREHILPYLIYRKFYRLHSFDRKYEGIAKFPAVTRDISMVMPKTVLVGEVEKIIEKRGGKLLEKYNLFDIMKVHRLRKVSSP